VNHGSGQLKNRNADRSPYAIMAENDRRETSEAIDRILQSEGADLSLLKKCLILLKKSSFISASDVG